LNSCPILLITFNRPKHTEAVLKQIRKYLPKAIYIFQDGPRTNVQNDLIKCAQVKETIINTINWNCTINTLYEDQNLGCGVGPAKAITWFFEQVNEGIILEDDCVPSNSFFPYCEELLKSYKQDKNIFMISGFNPLKKWKASSHSYIITKMGNSLGWATWKDRWNLFDYKMELWKTRKSKEAIKEFLNQPKYTNHFFAQFEHFFNTSHNDVWDFQWLFARWLNNGLTIVPSLNLISNIGFGPNATHSLDENDLRANLPVYELSFPLKHTKKKLDRLFDWFVFERFINPKKRNLLRKILFKLMKIVFRIH
jgi:hypothetical protein